MPFSIFHRLKNRLAHTAYLALLPIAPPLCEVRDAMVEENKKRPSRTDILNYLLGICQRISGKKETNYLEIGVRVPTANFSSIKAFKKFGVDPGIEAPSQDVDFRMTSDEFFKKLDGGEVLTPETRFDLCLSTDYIWQNKSTVTLQMRFDLPKTMGLSFCTIAIPRRSGSQGSSIIFFAIIRGIAGMVQLGRRF